MRGWIYLARLHAAVCAVAREQTKPDIDRFRAGKTGEVALLPASVRSKKQLDTDRRYL